jgi:hypothetical protein
MNSGMKYFDTLVLEVRIYFDGFQHMLLGSGGRDSFEWPDYQELRQQSVIQCQTP